MKRRALEDIPSFSNSLSSSSRFQKDNNPNSGSRDGPIPGMESVIATTSGYTGLEITKLIKLINQTGASYTGSLTKCNTHLVCWEFRGPKYNLAKKFGITIINHRWFEDSLQAGTQLSEISYIMCSGREVGPLSWAPPVAPEITKHIKCPSLHGQFSTASGCSEPIFISKPSLRRETNASKSQSLVVSVSELDNQENHRPGSTKRTEDVKQQMVKAKLQKKPMHDDVAVLANSKCSVDKVVKLPQCSTSDEVPQCATSNPNLDKQRRKNRRLVKKGEPCSIFHYLTSLKEGIEERTEIGNGHCSDWEINKENNLEIAAKPGHGASSSNIGIEFISCTAPSENIESYKQSNNSEIVSEQVRGASSSNTSIEFISCSAHSENNESCNDVRPSGSAADTEIRNDAGVSLPRSLPTSTPGSEISCAICWAESSSSRGILPCGHRFCFVCIRRWATEMVSKKKEPTCPLCLASFDFITAKNDATSNDQKIFSQTLPEFQDENVFMVLGQNGIGAKRNLQCNVCGSRDTEELLLRCCNCGKRAAHTFCLDPPLPPVPDVQWSCSLCTSRRRPFYGLP